MRFYLESDLNHSYQTWKKYFFEYDYAINAVNNYIDNFNANYILLNYAYDTEQKYAFYNDNVLNTTLQILVPSTDASYVKRINAFKLRLHQGIINQYGGDIIVYEDAQLSKSVILPEGFAVVRLTETDYLYVALSASGSFYIFNGWKHITVEGQSIPAWNFVYYDHAADTFGHTILLTITTDDVRWAKYNAATETYTYANNLYAQDRSIFTTQNYSINSENQMVLEICSLNKTLWVGQQYLLSYEIVTRSSNTQYNYEEIICDAISEINNTNIVNRAYSFHTITTNLDKRNLLNAEIAYY